MAFCWLNSPREVQWPRNLFFLLGLRSSYLGKHSQKKKVKKKVALKKAKKIGPKKFMLTASLNMGPEDWFGLMSVMSCHFTIVITLHDCDDNNGVQE